MSIVALSELQKKARKGGYAIPHVLGSNIEMTIAAISAAEESNSPIALGFAPEVFYMIPMEYALPMIVGVAKRAKVPVAVQLEHGADYETIAKAISLGMKSVMFDGSDLAFEENVRKTREIVKMAHAFGADVEAELGCVGGSALSDVDKKESLYTDPNLVLEFIDKTKIDSLAVSFGNFHGKYNAEPKLNYALVEEIAKLTDIPLTMHGGSGLVYEQYSKSIDAGISNIHFYTNITLGLWEHLSKVAVRSNNKPVYHELCVASIEYFKKEVTNIIKMLYLREEV